MISVIMSVYNEKISELDKSINSILSQSYKNIELIIVDDNPEDVVIKKYLEKIQKKYDMVRLIFNNHNIGQALSRNKGILESKGEYIAIMDADDIAVKDRLIIQLNYLVINNLDFVFSNFKEIDENDHIINDSMWNLKTTNNSDRLKYIYLNCSNVSLQSTWLLKREVYFKLNGYKDIIVEDFDFCLRSILNGDMQGFQSECLVYKRSRKQGIMQKNRLIIYLTVKLIKQFTKSNGITPTKKYIDQHINTNGSSSLSRYFDEFVLSFKNISSNPITIIKFFWKLIRTKYAISYIIDCLLLKIKEKIHGI